MGHQPFSTFRTQLLVSGTPGGKGCLTMSVYSDEPAITTDFFGEVLADLKAYMTVLKEGAEACGVGCAKCGAALDLSSVAEGGYVLCQYCSFWNRLPKWKR